MNQLKSRRRLIKDASLMIILLSLHVSILNARSIKTYQAEDAILYHAKTETEHTGFSGSGYVNFDNETCSYIEFTVFMGEVDTQTVYIRYANGAVTARSMQMTVNSTPLDSMPKFISTGAWTNWLVDSIDVYLIEGLNSIKFTSSTADGGPNMDKIDVSGLPGAAEFSLSIIVIGSGMVESTSPDSLFEEGETVSLLAVPDSGWHFQEWRGDTSGTGNPLSVVMNSNKLVTAVFLSEFDTSYQCENSPIGFATVDTLGQNGTFGGENGDTVTVETGGQLFTILDERRDAGFDENHPPLVIMVRGTLTWTDKEMMDFKENYDVSLIGEGCDARIEGFGLNLYRSHNIIIRNIEFRDAPDDCINITDPLSHHIWIDHCTFSDDPVSDPSGSDHDGLLDIKHGASFITVSWCHFYNHRKSNLIGHSESNGDEDFGRLKITYHHNWWESTGSRNPRIRFGEIHICNNYYDNSESNMLYSVGVTCYAQVFVEANFFKNVSTPVLISQVNDDEEVLSGNPEGYIMAVNNHMVDSGTIVENLENYAFNPSNYYTYQPDDPAALPTLLMALSGNGKIDPVPVSIKVQSGSKLPSRLTLAGNYPNPFNPTTRIEYTLSKRDLVNLTVFNMAGQEVARLVDETQSAGTYVVRFDASKLPSGVYLYRLQAGNKFLTRKMMLLK